MKRALLGTIGLFLILSIMGQENKKYVLAIHGGAGFINKIMQEKQQNEYKVILQEALQKGYDILKNGGESIDAVEATIMILENFPLFNAGRGSVLTANKLPSLDAAIMQTGKKPGAVAGISTIKNPITAARAVMNNSIHVMLSGKEADEFAQTIEQCITVDPSYFIVDKQLKEIDAIQQQSTNVNQLEHILDDSCLSDILNKKFGTVGAVAIDQYKTLAAGTSTGGIANKKYGRIGDSPIIGAGTYANEEVAVSCTGAGEYFIRIVAAYDVASLMQYMHFSVQQAAQQVIQKIDSLQSFGGMIAIDVNGNLAMPFNTTGMFRGCVTDNGEIEIYIF
ncbi:MAG: isoaspartyl peptidase/L-asparaginase family protein [Chitinophagaceae bacterium]